MQVKLTTSDGDFTGTVLEYEIEILSNKVELDNIKSYGIELLAGQNQYALRLTNGTIIIDRQDINGKRMRGFLVLEIPGIRDVVRIEILDNLRSLVPLPESEAISLTLMSYQKAVAVLGVKSSSSREEIETAYQKRINEYNPQRALGLGEKVKALAQSETRRINQARTLLLERLDAVASK